MNKTAKHLLIIVGVIAALWAIGRVTNMLQFFSTPTAANYPTLKQGDQFTASNLIKPKRFDFICFYATTPEFGRQRRVYRLCGIEGDKIEIKAGDLFINDKSVDGTLPLAHLYIFSGSQQDQINEIEKLDENFLTAITQDSIVAYISRETVSTHDLNLKRYLKARTDTNEAIQKQFSAAWNEDYFGPVVVPKGKYFVLGDNRENAQDSRYLGFIDKSDYVATVFGTK